MTLRAALLAVVALSSAGVRAQDHIFIKTDTQAEIELGRAAFDQVLSSGLLSKNEAYSRRVQRILDQLQVALPSRPYPFQAVVIADNSVNASALPGGYMMVNEGLLVTMPEDAQLAFVLGHEIGHAVRRHWVSKMRRMQTDAVVDILFTVLTNNQFGSPNRALQYLSYSRDHEYQADEFGTELYLRAGYPPDLAAAGMLVLSELDKSHGGKTPEYLSSHPDPDKRVERIKSLAKKLTDSGLTPSSPGDPIDVSIRSLFGDLPSMSAGGCDYLSFVPGTSWTYSVQTSVGSTEYTVRVIGCSDVLTSKVARFETLVGEKPVAYQMLADSQRIFRRNRPDKSASLWTIDMIIPELGGAEESGGVRYIHGGLETITTSAGIYVDCVKVQAVTGEGKVTDSWYAKGVGLVKRFTRSSGTTEELIRFKLG